MAKSCGVNKQDNQPRLKLLLVGAKPDLTRPSSLGGVSTLFHHLLVDLSERPGVETKVVDLEVIQRPGLARWLATFKVLLDILRSSPGCDVLSIHAGNSSLHLSGPALALIARVFGKPLIIRQGAGSHYTELPRWRGCLVRWAAGKAAFYLVETKRLVELARGDGIAHVRWFPNNRPLPKLPADAPRGRELARRFVFVSRVNRSKGVYEILQASRRLPSGASVDFYGPFDDDLGTHIFKEFPSASYRGILAPESVADRLSEYDVLLLPTYYPREGYPGIIIEAFAAGLPVICTRWLCLDELVNERCGILVTPKDPSSLLEAMLRIMRDSTLFGRLQRGALDRAKEFSSEVWTDKFVEYCRETRPRMPLSLVP
jgi:glycosyltransferase involved in cell wall biosynthesis